MLALPAACSPRCLPACRLQEQQMRDASRSDTGRLQADVRRLEHQSAELLLVFKKQSRLVEVLRRQRVHLEASRALELSEQEFMRLLDQGN
jgi:hypothetical protein